MNDERRAQINMKTGSRILFMVTLLSILLSGLFVFAGIQNTILLLWVAQLTILFGGMIGVFVLQRGRNINLRLKMPNFRTLVFAFLAIICAFPIISLLNLISMFFVKNALVNITSDLYSHGYLFSMISLALLPALGEELLMRGVFYHSYREKSPVLAWILSALIFGLFHMNFNQMPYAVFIGLVLAVMMEASNSLITPIWMHFLFNGISTTVGYFSSEITRNASGAAGIESIVGTAPEIRSMLISLILLSCVMLPLLLLVIGATFRVNGRRFTEVFRKKERAYEKYALPEVAEEGSFFNVWLVLAVLIMLIMTMLNTFL